MTYRAIGSGGAVAAAETLVHVLSGVESLTVIRADLRAILASAPRPPLRRRIEAAVRHVDRAIAELTSPAGSRPTAMAATSAAIGEMEDVRRRGLLDASAVRDPLNRMTSVGWVVSRQDLEAATGTGPLLAILVASALIDQGNAAHTAGQSLLASSLYGAASLVIVLASI